MRRILFIYNRHAGKNKTWFGLSDMINAMTEQNCLVTTFPTQYRGSVTDIIRERGHDYDQIVIAGGDGTLSEAISSARKMDPVPVIGYIPLGTTNDFSRNLDLPSTKDIGEVAATAVTGVPQTHDLGSFNDQDFLYVAAFGAFAQVSYSTPQAMKNGLGYNAYSLEGALNLTSIKPHHIKVEYDGNVIEGDYLYGMVSNTTSVGGVKNFPPGNPDLSDGLLEVTLISPIRGIKTVEEFGRAVLSGDPSVLSSVLTSFSTPKVTITSEAGLTWTLDGEPGGTHQVAEIEALHNAYTIVHGER